MARSTTKRDYYEVLNVSRTCSDDDIKKSYRKLALQYHPDRNSAPEATERFKEATEAYQVLSDAEKRSLYDRYGHSAFDRNGGGASVDFSNFVGLSIEDLFESFFGSPGQRGARQRVQRGQDLRYDMHLSLEEAVFGVTKEISLTKHATCARCTGNGMEPGSQPTKCTKCEGSGEIRRMQQSIFGQFVNVTLCDRCNGEGQMISDPCHDCQGRGVLRAKTTVQVDVPQGADEGIQLRLTGQGEPAPRGGVPGHLYVVLHVQPHRFFKRQGNDLLLEVPINVAQAALGDEFSVPTLDNKELPLKIPAGTQSGRIIRMRGEGVPFLREHGRGDLQVHVKVRTPADLTEEQKKLFKQLSATFGSSANTPTENKSFFDKVKDVFGGG
ncbi:MAG TPA: molecular chaperone DnaJ [Chloroflexota bacterium]|nr:molecular chaperone DnaJ [Chloroflexota bacterium]